MAELLDDMGTYLDADTDFLSAFTMGINLFGAKMPDAPDACICIYEYDGNPNEYTMGNGRDGQAAFELPRLQVQVRGVPRDYSGPRSVARSVSKSLSRIMNQTINGTYYIRVSPITAPVPLRVDDADRVYITFNAEVFRVHST